MEEPLFISNSDATPLQEREAGRSVFRTVVTVLAVLLACELALRVTGWPKSIPYELGGEEYNAVAGVLNRNEVPEVLVVGSSRAREAIYLPLLKELLSERAGRPVTVGSYAVSGALMSDVDAIVSRALHAKHPPKIILYGIAERDLNRASPIFDQAARFWGFRDWIRATEIAGLGDTAPELATVMRNEIGQHLRMLGEREQLRLAVRQRLAGSLLNTKSTLIFGEPTEWQKTSPRRNLVSRPAPTDKIRKNVETFERHGYPDPNLTAYFHQLIARCSEGETELILFEVPPSKAVRKSLPKNVRPAFYDVVASIRKESKNVRFLSAQRLELFLDDRHFRDMAHLNVAGATKTTHAIADVLYPPPTTQPSTGTSSRPAKWK